MSGMNYTPNIKNIDILSTFYPSFAVDYCMILLPFKKWLISHYIKWEYTVATSSSYWFKLNIYKAELDSSWQGSDINHQPCLESSNSHMNLFYGKLIKDDQSIAEEILI